MNTYQKKASTPKRTYFPYLSREDFSLNGQRSKICLYNKYTFNSILSPNFDLFSIYLHFFHSPYKKNKEVVSIFYEAYCRHICFHYQMLEENGNIGVDQIIQQFFHGRRQEENNWEKNRLLEVTRECLEKVLKEIIIFKEEIDNLMKKRQEDIQSKLKMKKDQNQYKYQEKVVVNIEGENISQEKHQRIDLQSLQKIERNRQRKYFWLQKKKQNIENTLLIIKQNEQKIRQQQFFPFQPIQQPSLLPFFTAIFNNLNNIHVLLRSQKILMCNYMISKGNFINTPIFQLPRFFQQKQIGNSLQITKISQIFTAKKTDEKYPIITSLKNFLKRAKDRSQFINYEIAKDLIISMDNFRKDYQRFFPQIQSKKVTMNQKSLQISFQQSHFILQAFGIVGKTNSPQLSIVFSPTPEPFNYQKSPFEYQSQYIKSRIFKYYMSQQQIRKQTALKEQYNQETEVNYIQNSHVWRIISILYLTFHTESQKTKYFSNRCYRMIYPQQNVSFDAFIQANKRIITQLKDGLISFYQILDIKQRPQSKKKQYQKSFNFTMRELLGIFDIRPIESEQQTLQMTKYYHEFSIRANLYDQIAYILTKGKKVKNSPNISKYKTIYLLGIISFMYSYYLLIEGIKYGISSLKRLLLTPLKLSQSQILRHFDNIFGSLERINNYVRIRQPKRQLQLKMIKILQKTFPLVQKYRKKWQNLIIIYNTFQAQKVEQNISSKNQSLFIYEQFLQDIKNNELQSIKCYNESCQQLLEHTGKQFQKIQKQMRVKFSKEDLQKKSVYILSRIFVILRKENIVQYDRIYNKAQYREFYSKSKDEDQYKKDQRYYENLCVIEQRLKENTSLYEKLQPLTNNH